MAGIIGIAIQLLHAIVTILTPAGLLILVIYLVKQAFEMRMSLGVQSLAGALLPIVFMTFAYVYNSDLFHTIGRADALVGFIPSLVWGFIVMLMIRFLIGLQVPLSEFVLSATFSVLVFGYVAQGEDGRMLSYYYGVVSGFLLYVFLLGLPTFKKKSAIRKQSSEVKTESTPQTSEEKPEPATPKRKR